MNRYIEQVSYFWPYLATMKDYFTRLFNYDQFANHSILTLLKAANYPEKPVQLMTHLLSAQQIWITEATI